MKRLTKALSVFAVAALLSPAREARAGRPVFQHHRENHDDDDDHDHYQHKGAKAAKAKIGGLTVRSRALIGKDGLTEIEISTGAFDSTAPGNISEVHIRAVDPRGKDEHGDNEKDEDRKDEDRKRFSRKFENLRQGGYVHWTFPGLPHGQQLRIDVEAKATVHGDEVEVKLLDTIRYRPHLVAERLDAPQLARMSLPIDVTATVSEVLREVGAHTDCVLYVDDVQVDAAPNAWVDAGTVQSCRLAVSIGTSGLHTLKVRVQNTRPGNYDDSNSTVAMQVMVQNPLTLAYTMSAADQTKITKSVTDVYYAASSATPDQHVETLTTDYAQSRSFCGSLPVALGAPTVGGNYQIKRVAFSDKTGATALGSVEFLALDLVKVAIVEDPRFTSQSSYFTQDAAGRTLFVNRFVNDATKEGATSFSLSYPAGDTTTYSRNLCLNAAVRCTLGDFITNPGAQTAVRLADTYSADFTMEDGLTSYGAKPSMALVNTGSTIPVSSSSCMPRNFPGSVGKICFTNSLTLYGKSGVGSGQVLQQ
jgi:hypothetical protein